MLPSVPIDLLELDYTPPDYFGPAATFVLGVAILGVGAGSLIVTMLLRARQLARLQSEQKRILSERAKWPLSEGPNRVVFGKVECDRESGVAISVDVVQSVKQESSRSRSWYNWIEEERNVDTSPFYLVQEDGEIVFVEPGDRVLVVDALETERIADKPRRRLRRSKVQRDEQFYAYGDLHRGAHPRARTGYRDGAAGWILRPPRHRQKMLLATNAIEERYSDRVAFLRKWSLVFGAVWVAIQLFVIIPFGALALFGTHDVGTDVRISSHLGGGKKPVWHYVVSATTVDGVRCEAEVGPGTYSLLDSAEAPRVPMIHVGPFCRLGLRPTAPDPPIILGLIAALVAFGFARYQYKKRYAWYDLPKLVEYGGEGQWTGEV